MLSVQAVAHAEYNKERVSTSFLEWPNNSRCLPVSGQETKEERSVLAIIF